MLTNHAWNVQEAWERAKTIQGKGCHDMREDLYQMPMIRDLYNVPGMGGWAVDDDGNAVAYRMSGCPAMGDAPLASVNIHWYLPSNADD